VTGEKKSRHENALKEAAESVNKSCEETVKCFYTGAFSLVNKR
jgi:hypothetical protein